MTARPEDGRTGIRSGDLDDATVLGPHPVHLLRAAHRLVERGPTLQALLRDGVPDRSAALALDLLSEGYLRTSPDGRILQVNQALVGVVGHPAEELVDAPLDRLVADGPARRTASALVATSASTTLAELRLTTVSGEPTPVVAYVVPSHVDGEHHWLVAALDPPPTGPPVDAASLDELLRPFLHDLRSALYITWGFIDLLLRPDAPPGTDRPQEMLEIARHNLLKMQELITAARFSSEVRSPEARPAAEEVDPAALIESVLVGLRPAGSIELVVDDPPARPPTLRRQLVARSIEALLRDVLRRTDDGVVRVSVGTDGDDGVTVDVVGATDDRPRHGDDGLASGLALLTAVTRAHAGRSWVEVSGEGGTRFHLELRPVPDAAAAAEDAGR